MTQPITDITAAVAVLNERRWRGYTWDTNGLVLCNTDMIAIANSLVMGERIGELEAERDDLKHKLSSALHQWKAALENSKPATD